VKVSTESGQTQRGATTKRGDRKEKRGDGDNGAGAPLSALSADDPEEELLVAVCHQRADWSEAQARRWLDNNRRRIEDSVDASSRTPSDPQAWRAAVRKKVASWAQHERHAPILPSAPPPPVRRTTLDDLPPQDQARHRTTHRLKERLGRQPTMPEIIEDLRKEGCDEIADDLEEAHIQWMRLERTTDAEQENTRP